MLSTEICHGVAVMQATSHLPQEHTWKQPCRSADRPSVSALPNTLTWMYPLPPSSWIASSAILVACSAAYRMTAAQSFLSACPASAWAAVRYRSARVAWVTVYMSASLPCTSCRANIKMVCPILHTFKPYAEWLLPGQAERLVLHAQPPICHLSRHQLQATEGVFCLSLSFYTMAMPLLKVGSSCCLPGNLFASFPGTSCWTYAEGSVLCSMQSCTKERPCISCRAHTRCAPAAAWCG